MKHCRRCNLDYQNDHRFCAKCGGALAERDARSDAPALCSSCGRTLRPGWSFCGHCRAPVAHTSTQSSPHHPAFAPTFVESTQVTLSACPACRQPMEEGGGFCEHCGARADAEARPAPTAHSARDAVGHAPLDTSAFQPSAGTSTEGYEASEEFEADDAPEAFAGEAYGDGGLSVAEDDFDEMASDDEETLDEDDDFDTDEEADEEDVYEEAASDLVGTRAGADAAEDVGAAPTADLPSDEAQSAAPRPSAYGEPRPFAYGQPLPTFGHDEEAERTVVPAVGGGRKWIVIGGAGLAALLLVVVAAALLFRQTPTTDTPTPSSGVAANVQDTPATSQPVPPEGMVYIPGGKFFMGRDGGDDYERPRHEVTVTPFFIDKNEVTNEDYQKFVDVTGRAPRGWTGGKFPEGAGRWPVTGVSWTDVVAYAQWAGKRLPTEAEWEYAARGTDERTYPWGNEWREGLANAANSTRNGMAPVGEFKGASPFGLYDMVGNAWEWTSSRLQAYPGGRLPKQEGADLRVIRGGSWQSDRTTATTTYRWGWPAESAEDYSNTSFRCVKDVAADKR